MINKAPFRKDPAHFWSQLGSVFFTGMFLIGCGGGAEGGGTGSGGGTENPSENPLCGNAENQDNKPIYSCCKEGETFTDESLGCGAQAIYGCMQPSGTCVFRTTTGFESGCPDSMGCGACLGKDTNNAAGWCGEQ